MNELGSHYIRQMSVAIRIRAIWLLAPLSLCIETNEVSFVLSFSIDEKTYKAKHSNVEPLNIWCRFHANVESVIKAHVTSKIIVQ